MRDELGLPGDVEAGCGEGAVCSRSGGMAGSRETHGVDGWVTSVCSGVGGSLGECEAHKLGE